MHLVARRRPFDLKLYGFLLVCLGIQHAGELQASDGSFEREKHRIDFDGPPLTLWEKSPPNPHRALLLIHGRTWSAMPDFDLQVEGESRSLMDALCREGYATYALDLRGYGDSPRDVSGWMSPDKAVGDIARAVEFVRDANPLKEKPHLFGWSLGATLSQLYAQRHGESLESLTLFGYWYDPDRRLPVDEKDGPPPRERNTAEAAASDFITPDIISAEAIQAYVEAALAADPVRVDWRRYHQFNALNPEDVRLPTLLIQGERDPLASTEAHSRLFARLASPDRQWVILPRGDHAALLEDTMPSFVAAMVAFLERPRLK